MMRARVSIGGIACVGLLALLAALTSAATTQPPTPPPSTPTAGAASGPALDAKPASSLDSLAWLAGDWTGTLGKARIEEHWIPAAGKTMFGVSRTVVGDRTVMFEFLRLEQRPDAIVYLAQPNGRPPTEFRLTASGPAAATFENPQHDNPKVIRYWKDGEGTLVAEIEGDEKGKPVKQRFTFTRAPRS